MHTLIVRDVQAGSETEHPLLAEMLTIRLFDGRIEILEGLQPGDILLFRRQGSYVFCSGGNGIAILNRETSGQRNVRDGDEIRLGSYHLLYRSDDEPVFPGPRAQGFDWFRAAMCSLALLLALLFLVGTALRDGGSGDRGEGSGYSDGGEGVGKGDGGGFGDGEGPGRGFGDSGSGSGSGTEGEDRGAGSVSSSGTVAPGGSPATPEAGTGEADKETKVEPETVAAKEAPETKEEPLESSLPPPSAVASKIASFSVSPTAPPPAPAAAGGLFGERGGGGQVLGTGDVQVTLIWDTAPDVDLHVIDPNGERIWFEHIRSRSGGMLDVDDTQFDGPENVFWPVNGAPRGEYRVEVELYRGVRAGWQVRTRVDGKEQIFSGKLTRERERQTVTTFTR